MHPDNATNVAAFASGVMLGLMGAMFVGYIAYPWMVAKTIKRLNELVEADAKARESQGELAHKEDNDPSDAWKPKGWNMDSYYDDNHRNN